MLSTFQLPCSSLGRVLIEEVQPYYCMRAAKRAASDKSRLSPYARDWIQHHQREPLWEHYIKPSDYLILSAVSDKPLRRRLQLTTTMTFAEALHSELAGVARWLLRYIRSTALEVRDDPNFRSIRFFYLARADSEFVIQHMDGAVNLYMAYRHHEEAQPVSYPVMLAASQLMASMITAVEKRRDEERRAARIAAAKEARARKRGWRKCWIRPRGRRGDMT